MSQFLDGLVHAGVARGVERSRHRSFIGFHLAMGFMALAMLPLYLLASADLSGTLVAVLGLVALSAPVAIFVARTGRLGPGHLMISAILTVAITLRVNATGGIGALAVPALMLVPLEAALSGERQRVAQAMVLVLAAIAAIVGLEMAGLSSPGLISTGTPKTGFLLFMAYLGGIMLRMDALHRAGAYEAAVARGEMQILAWNIGDIVTVHDRMGDVVHAAPGIDRLAGIPERLAMGTGLFRHVHVADRPAFLTALADAMPKGASSSVEFRLRRAEGADAGSFSWMEMRCRSLEGEALPCPGACLVAVTRDISERKAHQLELERARRTAEEASHAKSRFLANVSHELRTPLNAIIGFSELLQSETCGSFTDTRQGEYVGLIHESGHHLLQVVNDILDMSKIEAGKLDLIVEPCDPGTLLRGSQRLLAHQAAARGVSLKLSVPGDIPEIQADPRACRQILFNLISNAIKFTDPSGEVTLGVRREGAMVALFVRDTGIGIAEQDIGRLGTPFVQVHSGYDRRHEGTGLGLSVVKGLAALHGGALKIESRLGHGTCVTVTLPIEAVVPLAPPQAERVVPLHRGETGEDMQDHEMAAAMGAEGGKRLLRA